MLIARAALVGMTLLLSACGESSAICWPSGDPACEAVAEIGSTAAGNKMDVLSVERADCAELNLTDAIPDRLLRTCWVVVITDDEVGTRDIAVFRDPEGEIHSQLCLGPRC